MVHMTRRLLASGATLAATAAMLLPGGGVAGAEGPPPLPPGVELVAGGLDGPFELQTAPWGAFYVVESAPGQITQVEPWNGDTNVVIADLVNPQGAVVDARGGTWIVTGGPPPPGEGGPPGPPPPHPASLLYVDRWSGAVEVKADLQAYELAHNPDGQPQFGVDGVPLDALSNPFYVVTRPGGVIVADGGANDVLSISRDGEITTLFTPPAVKTGACADRENNGVQDGGCDPVPTGLAWAPDGSLYVSTLGAEAPGAGIVYQINPYSGEVLDTITGFTAPTGVAVGDDGTVYVSEALYGMPEGDGPPPADFDPASIGRIVQVAPDGSRRAAPVTMPTGLLWEDGELYASAWSLAPMLPGTPPGLGQVVKVSPAAFVATDV